MKDGKSAARCGVAETARASSTFSTIHTLGFFGVHVRAQDGVDPSLIAALALEPFQQVGIQSQGD